MGEWTVKTAPTCTEKGVEHRLCTKCDAEQTREIDALGHDFSDEFTVDKAPTVWKKVLSLVIVNTTAVLRR